MKVVCLSIAPLLASGRLLAQQTSPQDLPLAEQIGMHYYIDERIAGALPGYVDFESNAPCSITVYLMDTHSWGDSARALFRHALPPDTSALAREYCAGRPQVQVQKARYTRAELGTFAERITTVLQEPALKVRSSVRVRPETLIVGAHNDAARKRAQARLARENTLPQDMLVYRVWKPEEVDGPVKPPRAAYLAVLDAIAAKPSEPNRPFVIDAASLPPTVTGDDLRRRGLRARAPADSCGTLTVVSFYNPPREFIGGRYWFRLSWRLNDYSYEVECPSGACRVRDASQLGGDKIALGCASAEFGVGR